MFVAILGRLPKLSIAELEAIFGKSHVHETAVKYHVPVLAEIPMYSSIPEACDQGRVEDLTIQELESLLKLIESL